jgi:hypothetical protein
MIKTLTFTHGHQSGAGDSAMRGESAAPDADFTLTLRSDGRAWILTAVSEDAREWCRTYCNMSDGEVLNIFAERADKFFLAIEAAGLRVEHKKLSTN